MGDPVITNVDLGGVILRDAEFQNDSIVAFATAGTLLDGTILAVDSVSKKFVPFVKAGVANENGIPKAVLTYPLTSAAVGDVSAAPMISGFVRKERLVIDADGDASNVDQDVLDQLRDYSITAQSVRETSVLDNQ